MRILVGMMICGGLAVALCGCGAPEAEFGWSEDTENLMPAAKKVVKEYTVDRFGTPAQAVAWQRLPIAFGGIPGRVTEVYRSEEDDLIMSLKVNFLTEAMIARYDQNLDGQLALSEFPTELQKEITPEKFQQADADSSGFLSGSEAAKLRVRSPLLVKETVSRLTELEKALAGPADEEPIASEADTEAADKELQEQLLDKDLLFVNGTFSGQKTKVTGVEFDETKSTATLTIWPPLSDKPTDKDEPIAITMEDVIVDFGRTMQSGRHLYMRHCVHCHGVTGDGNGPTAQYLNPRPRDYRDGVFKFVSTRSDVVRHPNRDDIVRVVRDGIPGTYMPSFAMLKEQEVTDVVEYVRYLAMRGEYEGKLNVLLIEYSNETLAEEVRRKVGNYERALKDFETKLAEGAAKEENRPKAVSESAIRSEYQKELEEYLKEDFDEEADEEATMMADIWRAAEVHTNVIYPQAPKPPSSTESIARGRQLYLSKCAVCHGAMAEGNGENTRGYQKDPEGNEYPEPGFFDMWGQPIQPRNLTTGIYRGGRRPLDIYRRIHQGIPGTPMQAFNSAFSDEQIWDLVDYVMSIPIDGAVPADVKVPLGGNQVAQRSAPANAGEAKPAVAESNDASGTNE